MKLFSEKHVLDYCGLKNIFNSMTPCYHFIPDSPRKRKTRSKNIMKNNKETIFIKIEEGQDTYNINSFGPMKSITFENLDEMFSFPKPRKNGSKRISHSRDFKCDTYSYPIRP